MFCSGDLIRVPSQVGIYKISKGSLIDYFQKTNKPKLGIFISYQNSKECVINIDGQNWLVETQFIRMLEESNGQIDTDKKRFIQRI